MKVTDKKSLGLCKKEQRWSQYTEAKEECICLNFLLSTAEYPPSKVLTFL